MELERILCYGNKKFKAEDFCEGERVKISYEGAFKKGNSVFELSLLETGEKYWKLIEYTRFLILNNIVL